MDATPAALQTGLSAASSASDLRGAGRHIPSWQTSATSTFCCIQAKPVRMNFLTHPMPPSYRRPAVAFETRGGESLSFATAEKRLFSWRPRHHYRASNRGHARLIAIGAAHGSRSNALLPWAFVHESPGDHQVINVEYALPFARHWQWPTARSSPSHASRASW